MFWPFRLKAACSGSKTFSGQKKKTLNAYFTHQYRRELHRKPSVGQRQQFREYMLKFYIILITSGTKKVIEKLLAECAISRVTLLP